MSASAVVGSIVESLKSVPGSAVPCVLECIMTSTALSPSSLFDSLLSAFSNIIQEEEEELATGYVSTFITALCYLLKKAGTHPIALQSFISQAFLPTINILNANNHHPITQQLIHIVSHCNSWDLIRSTLAPFALTSLRLSLGMPHNHNADFAIYYSTPQSLLPTQSPLPLPLSCHILTSLLLASSTTFQPQHTSSAQLLFTNLLWDTCNVALPMLLQTPHHRFAAIHLLLPCIFRIFTTHSSCQLSIHGKIHTLSRGSFFHKIWNSCQTLFSLGPLERRDAYTILSLYFSVFYLKQESQDMATCDVVGEFDIRTQQEFWDEIKRGLVDKAAFVRKQSLDMLKMSFSKNTGKQCFTDFSEKQMDKHSSVPLGLTKRVQWAEKEAQSLGVGKICNFSDANSSGQQRWDAFVLLYEMLEEYGTHLVEAAWHHQISILLHFPCPQRSHLTVTGGVHHSQMEALEGTFSWLAVIWERGLCHENPQVRCLIMQSLLSIDWKDHGICGELLPAGFITGPFLLGLNDTVHHKDFGAKGVYSSKTMEQAKIFVSQFCEGFNWRQRITFMHNLASRTKEESFCRAGLMAFSACVASVGSGVEWCEVCPHDVGQLESSKGSSSHNSKADLLDTLRLVIESCKQHFNLNYRHQVCENVLEAASTVMCTCDIPVETLMHFISTVPPELTDYGGALRGNIQNWFFKCNKTLTRSNSFMTRKHVFNSLCEFPERFVECNSPDTMAAYDNGDLESWEFEARRWARVLFLILMDGEYLEEVFKFLQKCGTNICNQKSQLKWLPSKILVLNLSLVQELQVMRMKCIGCGIKARSNIVLESDSLFLSEASAIFEKFTFTFHLILEELVSFAKSACSTFWCFPVVASHLPSSVCGRLGGPSQRRLESCTTVAVLEAILSMKTVASLSAWCAIYGSGNSVDFTFTFLWNFSMKVILSPKDDLDSETEAEISLASYEALVPVVNAVASSMTPMLVGLIMASDKSLLPEVNDGHWIDSLLFHFLQNINELLASGELARSRRAILMNWKWLCLNSLLTILCGIIQNGSHFGNNTSLISTTLLKCMYSDLIGSLEKASESSVLPILRSVRLVLELFSMGRLGSSVLSSDGLNIEMIWELVNSSWILHVSCNKRRVAHIAALLSSALHCSVFCEDRMHDSTENTQGPCKWFVGKIIDEATKSPRTIRLAALHLTGLWLVYPRTIRYYTEELKLLSLYGSVAFDEDFESELAENPDAKAEVSLLAKGSDIELTEAFINTELYARVSVAVLFYELANLADQVGTIEETDDCRDAHFAGKSFLLKLLGSVVNDNDLAKELYKKNSGIHRRKIRAWQMICILSRFVDEEIVHQVTSSLHICLYRNNMPSVRQYLEIFAVQIYLKFPSLVEEQLCPIFQDYDMKPQALASYVFIAANIILHATEEVIRLRHLSQLLPPITPLLTSHHHSLRGFTQLLVYKVLTIVVPALDYKDSEIVPLEKKCFMSLKSYLEKNSDCAKLRTSMEDFLDAFDPNTSATPTGLFTAREGIDFECVPTSLMEQVNAFLNDVREELRGSIAKDMVILSNETLATGKDCNHLTISPKVKEERLHLQVPKDIYLDFQKKITLSKPEGQYADINLISEQNEFSRPFVDLEKEDQLLFQFLRSRNLAMENKRANRQDFILVASLLDRIPNVAGLARTCEVFNASGLAVSDASIVRDKQFQLISVTAEKWVPMTEVPVSSIKVFLQEKKQEGFSILGLEQTANSVPLDQYAFPRKTVLVLGREKEGIPVDIIHNLDACVEIPQLGVVRSLNVHVSGAIALWEYTRQQRFQQN